MIELWQKINFSLNLYGGLISIISLIVSIFIYFKTGQIKKNIKSLLKYDKYEEQKRKIKSQLENILKSIENDDIFDKKIIGEIARAISTLEHYSIFFNKKSKNNINNINILLQADFEKLTQDKMIIAINKIIGDLVVREPYVG